MVSRETAGGPMGWGGVRWKTPGRGVFWDIMQKSKICHGPSTLFEELKEHGTQCGEEFENVSKKSCCQNHRKAVDPDSGILKVETKGIEQTTFTQQINTEAHLIQMKKEEQVCLLQS